MRISDEIRNWFSISHCASGLLVSNSECDRLLALADRIDSETVELPKDRDGAPIHLGDTVYLEDGRKAKVYSIELTNGKDAIRESITVNIQGLMHCTVVNIPSSLTHTNPDSWERIADELEAWCDDSDVDGDACDVPRAIAGRIRTLAKREGEQCQ